MLGLTLTKCGDIFWGWAVCMAVVDGAQDICVIHGVVREKELTTLCASHAG